MGNILSKQSTQFLQSWHSNRPSFALMGEFSAGKSTLLNLILGRTLLPTQVTPTNMPAVWITHGKKECCHILGSNGSFEAFDLGDLPNMKFDANQLLLRLELPIKALEKIDIIDTPGISEPLQQSDYLEFLFPYLDFVVWCSAANQAWRQSEVAVWNAVPDDIYDNSILVLTRADMVKRTLDLKKVLRRCKAETTGKFGSVVPVAALNALMARDKKGGISNHLLWVDSQADVLFHQLHRSIDQAIARSELREAVAPPQVAPRRYEAAQVTAAGNGNAALLCSHSKAGAESTVAAYATGPSEATSQLNAFQVTSTQTAEQNLSAKPETVPDQLLRADRSTDVSTEPEIRLSQKEREDTETLRKPLGSSWSKFTDMITGAQKPRKPDDDYVAPSKKPTTTQTPTIEKENNPMANTDISELAQIGGFIGACLVDSETGLMMASEGGGKLDLEAAGAANTEVVKAKLAAMEMLGLNDSIDDILITLGKQFHLIRPLANSPSVFIYVALDKKTANLGMARVQVKNVEKGVSL